MLVPMHQQHQTKTTVSDNVNDKNCKTTVSSSLADDAAILMEKKHKIEKKHQQQQMLLWAMLLLRTSVPHNSKTSGNNSNDIRHLKQVFYDIALHTH